MTLFLKVLHDGDQSPVGSDNPHSVYSDIVSVHFSRLQDGSAQALCHVRDPIKTAMVAGTVENERYVVFNTIAYVMNEDGKTVSSFSAKTSGHPVSMYAA